ncbi:MAG: hypothetical protein COA88_02410 [Kordia sp.]|nr:MAG: hypothetical protein COA88_02410 [Kordia sp.]
MKKKLLIKPDKKRRDFSDIKEESIATKVGDIAIIGLDCKFGAANNEEEFWNALITQSDLIRPFPEQRKIDVLEYLKINGVNNILDDVFLEGAYLDHIDQFDYSLFGLSPKEAALLDPNQRLVLQSSWKALENSGYGGDTLKGSQTGIYIGYSSDFGEQYKNIIRKYDQDAVNLSIAGNVKSIIASRIAYYLDFHGPSVLIDTACSSSLVAVHQACAALRNGDCNVALAGGVKIHLVPTRAEQTGGIGIFETTGVESKTGRTQTFNEGSDGTGIGEGVAMLVLKPLEDAIRDKDNIRAVVIGSSVNQDGNSVGITAPNSESQEKLLLKAWKQAAIDPEDISYIEAHGTGTKLGDPIEVSGLTRAFRKFTNKKQFCAIGSVKTNIGHLDNAAGISGLIKVILSIENNQIPPILHFNAPNKEIDFENSPFKIADKKKSWERTNDKSIIAGISSFGLSGTNCHVVLQDYVKKEEINKVDLKSYILPVSANSNLALTNLLKDYKSKIEKKSITNSLDLVATASIGRSHLKHKIIICFTDLLDLQNKINLILENEIPFESTKDIFYGTHQIIHREKDNQKETEFTENQLIVLSKEINEQISGKSIQDISDFDSIIKAYCKGASIDWEILYKGHDYVKAQLPSYPFDTHRCWVAPSEDILYNNTVNKVKEINHALLDNCVVRTEDVIVFNTEFSTNRHWELRDHKIRNNYLLPGTAYIEMIYQAAFWLWGNKTFPTLSKLMFVNPLNMDLNEVRNVQTVFVKDQNDFKVNISSKNTDDEWIKHVECRISFIDSTINESINLETIKINLDKYKKFEPSDFVLREIETGARWHCAKELSYSEDEFLVKLNIPAEFAQESKSYFSYPSLLDSAVNATNFVVDNGLFLPFSYGELRLFKQLPTTIYSYFKKTHDTEEIKTFDIKLTDENGNLVGEVLQYSIKRVGEQKANLPLHNLMHQLVWKKSVDNYKDSLGDRGIEKQHILLFVADSDETNKIIDSLHKYHKLTTVKLGLEFKIDGDNFTVRNTTEDFEKLFDLLQSAGITNVVHALGHDKFDLKSSTDFINIRKQLLHSMFNLTKALVSQKFRPVNGVKVLTKYAEKIMDLDTLTSNPVNATLKAFTNVADREYPKVSFKFIDIDNTINAAEAVQLSDILSSQNLATREGAIYFQELQKVNTQSVTESYSFDEKGTYVITGGFGGLGYTFASKISEEFPEAKIALLVRKALSSYDNNDPKGNLYKNRYELLRNKNNNVAVYVCDFSSVSESANVISKITAEIGAITGVIHTAGKAGNGYIVRKDEKEFEQTLLPKIDTTWGLINALKGTPPQWITLFSSITSFLAEPGQSDYAAANAYLDALNRANTQLDSKIICINWAAWKEIGMAVDHNVDLDKGEFKELGINEGWTSFKHILSHSLTNVVVGQISKKELAAKRDLYSFEISDEYNINKPSFSSSTIIKPKQLVVNAEDVEQIVKTIWQVILGLDDIDEDDNFYDLGGNSIMATGLLKEYEKSFSGVVDVADIFSYSTIKEMSQFIQKELGLEHTTEHKEEIKSATASDNMDEILRKLSEGLIPLEEAGQLIKL